jgi:phosphomevalonate decarboxylase
LKATAVAYPIQGLVKYHGLKDPDRRIPYHDSISVCIQALSTVTTAEALQELEKDELTINGREASDDERRRVQAVINRLKELAGFSGGLKIVSENSLKTGKGLGFSASAFAALGVAASKALGLRLPQISLSEIVRLGAGSSTRSLAGNFSIWYADKSGRSYAEQLNFPKNMDFWMVVVPIPSELKSDEAHAEVLSSCLFQARLKNINSLVGTMKRAISKGDTATIGRLAEEDTLNLHAITMTGKSHMVLWEPDTLRIMKEVIQMRKEGAMAWYSMDTGPSVFINAQKKDTAIIAERLRQIGFKNVLTSTMGGRPFLTSKHLF